MVWSNTGSVEISEQKVPEIYGSGQNAFLMPIQILCDAKVEKGSMTINFFFNMGQSRPLFVYFCSFLIPITISII